ncbi:MAG: ribosomal protein S18-alanine N-acetyltransferase [Gammaproteobacteria bacterium]
MQTTSPNTLDNYRFRQMLDNDLSSVLSIEQSSYDFPWSLQIFKDCLKVKYCCRVVLYENEIVGYGIMSFGAGEAHILNLCIRNDLRRQGLGRSFLAWLIDEARLLNVENMFLEVRPSNTAAIRLYESVGFNEIGLRKAYYPTDGGRENALILGRAM